MANDTIAVATPTKTETQALNGGMTLGDSLAKFFNVTVREVEGRCVGQMVRLNNGVANIPGDLNTPLRGGDYVAIFPNEIARGGVKGAGI